MVTENVGETVLPAATGMKPESKPGVLPPRPLTHGFAKVDCVAEWLPAAKANLIESPTFAVMLEGEKVRVLFPPTTTVWTIGIVDCDGDGAWGFVTVALPVPKAVCRNLSKEPAGGFTANCWQGDECDITL